MSRGCRIMKRKRRIRLRVQQELRPKDQMAGPGLSCQEQLEHQKQGGKEMKWESAGLSILQVRLIKAGGESPDLGALQTVVTSGKIAASSQCQRTLRAWRRTDSPLLHAPAPSLFPQAPATSSLLYFLREKVSREREELEPEKIPQGTCDQIWILWDAEVRGGNWFK